MHVAVSESATMWVAVMFGGFAVLSLVIYHGIAGVLVTGKRHRSANALLKELGI